MFRADDTDRMSRRLLAEFVHMLEGTGDGIVVDLTAEPPMVTARSRGRIFTAAWPSDGAIRVRLRLEDPPPTAPNLEHISPGSLAYEASITRPEQIHDLGELLVHAREVADAGHDPDASPVGHL